MKVLMPELELQTSHFTAIGGNEKNEDRGCIALYKSAQNPNQTLYTFFGVFDGHGGEDVAQYVVNNLRENITSNKWFWSKGDDLIMEAIKLGFLKTHHDMWEAYRTSPTTGSARPFSSGTTATVGFIKNGKLYVGHVGDSSLALGTEEPESKKWNGTHLTKRHAPTDPEERRRILGFPNGKIQKVKGVERVVWTRPLGHTDPFPMKRVTNTRALGNFWSYSPEKDDFMICPVPECSVLKLDKTHKCLIVGSDGLWDMMSAAGAVQFVQTVVGGSVNENGNNKESKVNVSKALVGKALELWRAARYYADNVSAITILLKHSSG